MLGKYQQYRQDRFKCQNLYLNMINVLDHNLTNDGSQYYLKLLNETSKCDQFSNFELLRHDMDSYINKDLDNLEVQRQAVLHYRSWHQNKLLYSLSLYNKLYRFKNLIKHKYF